MLVPNNEGFGCFWNQSACPDGHRYSGSCQGERVFDCECFVDGVSVKTYREQDPGGW